MNLDENVSYMDLMKYLEKEFGKNEPIFTEEINSNDFKNSLLESASNLIRGGWIAEYSENIYYIPTSTPFGKSTLSPNKVYEKKYLRNKLGVMGYYSGIKLLNLMGLTTQLPNVVEITTNKAEKDKQLIKEGQALIELKRPAVEITKENVDILQFLEAVLELKRTNYDLKRDDEIRKVFKAFIFNHQINKEDIIDYIPYYPEDVKYKLYESKLLNELK